MEWKLLPSREGGTSDREEGKGCFLLPEFMKGFNKNAQYPAPYERVTILGCFFFHFSWRHLDLQSLELPRCDFEHVRPFQLWQSLERPEQLIITCKMGSGEAGEKHGILEGTKESLLPWYMQTQVSSCGTQEGVSCFRKQAAARESRGISPPQAVFPVVCLTQDESG